MKKILIVEDNREYADFVADELKLVGYDVEVLEHPIRALEYFAKNKYDAVISDLNLPVMSGVQLTESVKNISPNTVCVILTGKPDDAAELESISNNIDLYIEKTKSIDVIVAYMDKLLIESEVSTKDVILYSNNMNLKLVVDTHKVIKGGEEIELTPTEYEMLRIFLSNKNVVISREDFVEMIWGNVNEQIDVRLVDNHIKNLRDKLKSLSIMTVRGYGYRWNEVE